MEIIAFDSHKRYTHSRVENEQGLPLVEQRIPHQRGKVLKFLSKFSEGSTVAVETIGNWYWIVDEIEEARMRPALVHARKAKLMMGMINKTDRLDAKGLALLQRNGTLPTVWIPPADVRDKRDLGRTRMVFSRERARLKNRIHSVLAKYGLHTFGAISDIFGKKGRALLEQRLSDLPPQTRFTTECLLKELDSVEARIREIESRMKEVFTTSPEITLLMTLPGVGFLLAVIISNEMGAPHRFPDAAHFAAYAGTTPRVHASGGKVRFGPLRPDVNHYLKWAFSEAANSVCVNRKVHAQRHVSALYNRLRKRKGHQKAIGAVARHLAEAAWCVVKKGEPYRERGVQSASSRKA